MKYHDVASIVFVNKINLLIFQQRDNKPGIRNPGMVTTWGGAVEAGETPIKAAVREIKEETNLQPSQNNLEFIGKYYRDYKVDGMQVVNYMYLLKNVDETELQVYEGDGYVLVDPKEKIDSTLYTEFTKMIIAKVGGRGV